MEADEYPPLSALNHLLFCPRRCALLRIEGVWIDNVHTVEGTHSHRRVHASPADSENEGGVRSVRGLWLSSHRLRIVGVADLVEFRPQPFPVEYKKGRRRRWDNDDVQLCAQAMCLEEMLGVEVPAGAIFHLRSKRRREVLFDAALRRKTEETAVRLHELLASGVTPPPINDRRCKECSVNAACLPELTADAERCRRFALQLFTTP